MAHDDFGDIDREIRENRKQDALRRKAQWAKEHPRTTAMTTGWGKAVKKEGKDLGRQVSHEVGTTVTYFGDELGRLLFGR